MSAFDVWDVYEWRVAVLVFLFLFYMILTSLGRIQNTLKDILSELKKTR
jgi:hypothetical protein